MIYVTDTHPFLWFLLSDNKLSKNARDMFDMAELGRLTIVIPSIVLLELMRILEKQGLLNKFKETIEEIENTSNYEIFPLEVEVIKKVSEIKGIGELHDRIIIATAQLLNCPLITKDEEIIKSNKTECIW